MSFFSLVTELETLLEQLNTILAGGDDDTVKVNGIDKDSISKVIKDKFSTLQAMVQGKIPYETKSAMDAAGAPENNKLAEVWNDSNSDNNGLYGWKLGMWVKSEYDSKYRLERISHDLLRTLQGVSNTFVFDTSPAIYERGDYKAWQPIITSSIKGWASPFTHNGQSFNAVQTTIRANAENVETAVKIFTSDFELLATGFITVNTTNNTYVILLNKLISGTSAGEVLYIAWHSRDLVSATGYPAGGDYGADDVDPNIHREKYISASGTWVDAGPIGNYRAQFRLLNIEEISKTFDPYQELDQTNQLINDTIQGLQSTNSSLSTLQRNQVRSSSSVASIFNALINSDTPSVLSIGDYKNSDPRLAPTIHGWAFAFKHNGAEFNALQMTFRANLENTPVVIDVLDSTRTIVLATAKVYVGAMESHLAIFDGYVSEPENSILYIRYYNEGEEVGIGYPAGGDYEAGEVDPEMYPSYYLANGWKHSSPVDDYRGQFRALNLSTSFKNLNLLPEPIVISTPTLTLPSRIIAKVGTEYNLYYDAILEGESSAPQGGVDGFDIQVYGPVGRAYERQWRITPVTENIGEHTLTIKVFDKFGKVLITQDLNIAVIADTAPAAQKTVLMLGDSLNSNGQVTIPLHESFNALGGVVPKFVGQKGNAGVQYEAWGGWRFSSFATSGMISYRFNVSGATTINIGDKYTNNGSTFTVIEVNTTDGDGNISTTKSGANEPLSSGILTRSTGTGDSSLSFSAYQKEAGNPLWNAANNQLDIANYRALINQPTAIDIVTIQLGVNDMGIQDAVRTEAELTTVVNYAKNIVDAFLDDNLTTKIIIGLPSSCGSTKSGFGVNYGSYYSKRMYEKIYLLCAWR